MGYASARAVRGGGRAHPGYLSRVLARDLINRNDACFTPPVVLAEVAHRGRKDGFEKRKTVQELTDTPAASEVIPITPGLAVAASSAARELQATARARRLPLPGLADGLILGTTRITESRLISADPHFHRFRATLWLG